MNSDLEEADGNGRTIGVLGWVIIGSFISVVVILAFYCLRKRFCKQRQFDKAVTKARLKLTGANNIDNNTDNEPVVHRFESYNRYFEVKYEELHRKFCCCVRPGPEKSGLAKIELHNNNNGYNIEGEYRDENTSTKIIEGFVQYSGDAWWIEDGISRCKDRKLLKVLASGKFDFASDTFTGSRTTNNGVHCRYTLFKGYEQGFENYFLDSEQVTESGPVDFDEAVSRARAKVLQASKDCTSIDTLYIFETYEGNFDVEYVDSGKKCSGVIKIQLAKGTDCYTIEGDYSDESAKATIVEGCAAYSGDAWWIEKPDSGTFGGLRLLTVGRFDFTKDTFTGTRVANSGASSPYIAFKGNNVSKQTMHSEETTPNIHTVVEGGSEDSMKQPLMSSNV